MVIVGGFDEVVVEVGEAGGWVVVVSGKLGGEGGNGGDVDVGLGGEVIGVGGE